MYALGNGQLEYEQKHVYAGSERIEQFTDKGNWERTLYVHEDVMGNTRYYTKATGQNFAELEYDAWGLPVSPNKLVNNDHGNYVFATFTGHIYDTVLDVYFAEARFYDAANRQWLAMDPIKSGLNWYQYCASNPITNWDPTGLWAKANVSGGYQNKLAGSGDGNWIDTLQNIGAFAWGSFTAVAEDFAQPYISFKDRLLKALRGRTSGLDGVLDSGGLLGEDEWGLGTNVPVYDVPFGKTNAFSAGRLLGHVGGVVIGFVRIIQGVQTIGGSGAMALISGGTAAPAAAVIAGVGVEEIVAGGAMVLTATKGLWNDPNVQFSVGSQDTSNHMLGQNGVRIGGSKTVGQQGTTERVDVENPAPGQRPGDIHYHEPDNRKWRYEPGSGKLIDPESTEVAPPRVQRVVEEEWFQKAIQKGLRILGE